jgi:signal transduction histidine kinase
MDDFLDFHKLAIVVIDTIALWLVILVVSNSEKKKEKLLFVLMTLGMILWVNFAYLARIVDSVDFSILFLKIAWFVTPPFFLFIYYFSLSILKVGGKYKGLTIVNSVITIISSILVLGDYVIDNRKIVEGSLAIEYGNAMWPFMAGVAVLMFSVIFLILKHWKDLGDEERSGARPYIIGLVFFYILNLVFNISLPIFTQITRYYFFGDYSTIILTILVAYSVFRYKFLGVKVLLSSFLLSVLGMMLLIDILALSVDPRDRILKIVIFSIFVFVGFLLQKSIIREAEQKKQIERINKQLKQSQQKYKNLSREQKDIIDVMGHEIRTPLTAIVQELNLIEKVVLPEKEEIMKAHKDYGDGDLANKLELVFEAVETIDIASTQAVSLVNNMLETARLDKNRFELNYSEFDLKEIVQNAVRVMEKTADENIDFSVNIENDSKDFMVKADKTRIEEAVSALLSNAIKYRDPNKDTTKIIVNLAIKGGQAIVEIKDNGIGIAKEDIAKLGKKFLRLDPKLHGNLKRPGGTGLGLFVVKGIMNHHGGELEITSEGLHKGSSFKLRFPTDK